LTAAQAYSGAFNVLQHTLVQHFKCGACAGSTVKSAGTQQLPNIRKRSAEPSRNVILVNVFKSRCFLPCHLQFGRHGYSRLKAAVAAK
jgi:hypothetical protein